MKKRTLADAITKYLSRLLSFSTRLVEALARKRARLWLLFCALLLAVGWHYLPRTIPPRHVNEIVEELGSIGRFKGTPMANSEATKMVFIRTTDLGYGVFLADLPNGPRKLLYENVQRGTGFGKEKEKVLGWSPDDKLFAYSREPEGCEIVICDGITGASQAVLPTHRFAEAAVWLSAEALAFVGGDGALYLIRKGKEQWLRALPFRYFRKPGQRIDSSAVKNLVGMGADWVAWRQGATIMSCGVDWPAPVEIGSDVPKSRCTAAMEDGFKNAGFTFYERGYNKSAPSTGLPPQGSTFQSLSSPQTSYSMPPDYSMNNALLVGSNIPQGALRLAQPAAFSGLSLLAAGGAADARVAYTVHFANGMKDSGTFTVTDWLMGSNAAYMAKGRVRVSNLEFASTTTDKCRLFSVDIPLKQTNSAVASIDFNWVPGTPHTAIFALSGGRSGAFAPVSVHGYNADLVFEANPMSIMTAAHSRFLSLSKDAETRQRRFFISSRVDEPAAIWQRESGDVSEPTCVVPNVEKPFRYARIAPYERGVITNSAGEQLTFYMLSPRLTARRAKNPVVLGILGMGEMGFAWSANHEAFANCGAFFLTLERNGRNSDQWTDDVLAAYEMLKQRSDVDSTRVYLYGDSMGSHYINNLLAERPELWRGAVLFSPVDLPDPDRTPGMRFFVDCGGSDGNIGKRAAQFQDSAARLGMPVTLLVHPKLGHTHRVPKIERARMRGALEFLFGS